MIAAGSPGSPQTMLVMTAGTTNGMPAAAPSRISGRTNQAAPANAYDPNDQSSISVQ